MAVEKISGNDSLPRDPSHSLDEWDGERLRAEIKKLQAERTALLDRQRRVMELIGTADPDHLVHDIRNLLNEVNLLRALTEGEF